MTKSTVARKPSSPARTATTATDAELEQSAAEETPAAPTTSSGGAKAVSKRPAAPRKPAARRPTAAAAAAAAAAAGTTEAPPADAASDAGARPTEPAAAPAPKRPARTPRTPAKPRTVASIPPSVVRDLDPTDIVLSITGLTKKFGSTIAVGGLDLDVPKGSFYGIVGPNGAGKTTTLSMVTGLLRPDGGSITVLDQDVWRDPAAAKRLIGVLPDRLRVFDRLTGRQLLHYAGTLRGLDSATVSRRSDDLATAFGLEEALGRLVSDYSAGMTKKIALACSMIHSPRLLVLDEPFESVDPVSAANVVEILEKYVSGGGTVVLSSHSMDMIQRVCDRVAIIVEGRVLAKGTVDEVRLTGTLEQRFVELAGGRKTAEGMEWLLSSSD